MPTYPIFYTIQNDKDSTQNVFSFSFNEESNGSQLKLKHIIKEFPIDLENDNYHIRFKIQCNEVEPKMFAWIDPSNLDARAPIINNAVYIKLLHLTKEGDSKLYNKQKILKAKSSISNQQQAQDKPQQQKEPKTAVQKSKQAHHANITHANSDPDLVHNKSLKANKIFDADYKDFKNSHFQQKTTPKPETQPQKQPPKAKDLFDDSDDHDDHVPRNLSEKNPPKTPADQEPKSGVINFFDSDDEQPQQVSSANNLGNKGGNYQGQAQTNFGNNQGSDLLDESAPQQVYEHHKILIHETKAPLSEFDKILKSRENEYIFNGIMDGKKLKKVKEEILAYLQQKMVDENKEEEDRKRREQEDKKDAKVRLQSKVNDWKDNNGTRKDIRTLLSTLQNVLWAGADWAPVSFFDLSTEDNLKSTIKKVQKKFHPDRNRDNMDNKFICEQIIDEIKQAQKDYDNKQQK